MPFKELPNKWAVCWETEEPLVVLYRCMVAQRRKGLIRQHSASRKKWSFTVLRRDWLWVHTEATR